MSMPFKSRMAIAFRAITGQSFSPGDPALSFMFGGYDQDSGLMINDQTAMQLTAAHASVMIISKSVAMLPAFLYQRVEGDKNPIKSSKIYDLIHRKPNQFQTAFQFKQLMMRNKLITGNAYAEIVSDGSGIAQIIPRNPHRVTPFWVTEGVKAYWYQPLSGKRRLILADEMIHLMWFSDDGLKSISPVQQFARTFSLGIGAEKYGASVYKNGAVPRAVVTHPDSLTEKALANLKKEWNATYGKGNSNSTAILDEGMEVKAIQFSPEDAQLLDSRQFTVKDIARIWGVPPHMIQDLDKSAFSNIEMQSLEFVIYSLGPHLTDFEEELTDKLLTADQIESGHFIEFMIDALLRGDIKARYAAYAVARQWGWLNVNEIRAFENMNSIDGGDQYMVPLNMVPANENRSGMIGDVIDAFDSLPGEPTGEQRKLALMLVSSGITRDKSLVDSLMKIAATIQDNTNEE